MKKLLTFILSLSLVLALAAPAMASHYEPDDNPPELPVSSLTGDEPDFDEALPTTETGRFRPYFTDCADYPVAEEAAELGLVHGYGDGTFRPLGTVTNGEWYQMLYNCFGAVPYYDIRPDESAEVEWMLDTLELMVGHEVTVTNWRQVSSGDFAARFEAVQLLLLAISVPNPEPTHHS